MAILTRQTEATGVTNNNAPLTNAQVDNNFIELVEDIAAKQPLDADLTAIAGLTGTSGFLKKTAANTWALDTAPSLAYLPLTGGTMTGNITFSDDGEGIVWSRNTDGAYIKFFNTADGDTDSRLEFATNDNGNEYFRWVHFTPGSTSHELMTLKYTSTGDLGNLAVTGSVTANSFSGDLNYSDITNPPTIPPPANNATITLSAGTYLSGGGDFTTDQSANETITFNHDNTTRSDTTSNGSPAHGGTFTAVDSVTTNTQGHVTAINVKTVTLPTDNNTDNYVDSLAFNTGNGILTVGRTGALADLTVDLDGRYLTSIPDSYVLTTGDTMTGDLTVSKVSPKIRLYDADGSTGTYGSIEWDSTNNQGASIQFNEFDGELPLAGYGLVVGPSSTNTQWPTTGDLSFSVLGEMYAGAETLGAVNRVFHDGYHPNADKWTTARTNTVTLTGSVTGSGSASVDGSGNWTVTVPTTTNHTHNYDNYGSWTAEDGDGTQYTVTSGDTLKFAEGTAIDVNFTADDVLTISHADTSTQGSVNNSNGTIIQDVTLDTNGHVTGLASLDGDARWVNKSGDTFTGTLTFGQSAKIAFPDITSIPDAPTNEQYDYITFGTQGSISQISGRGGLMISSSDDALVLANGDIGRTFTNSNITVGTETIYVLSDFDVKFVTGLQDGWGGGVTYTPKTTTVGADGTITSSDHGTSANWKQAYDNYITGISVTGTSTKTITLTQRDGGTIAANFTDIDTNTDTTYTAGDGLQLSGTEFSIKGNEIPGSIDLNTYRTTGTYSQNANADAASGSNYPTPNAGILQVINDDYGNGLHTTQLYSQYNSTNYWHRTYYNGTWKAWRNLAQDTDTVYSLPEATATTRGGIELFSDTDQSAAANAVSATAGRTYGIQLNADGQAVVNVPWSDTNTTNFNIQANGGTQVNISAGEEVNFINGTYTTAAVVNQANPTVTFNHNSTTRGDSTSAASPAHGGTFTAVDSVTTNTQGHVTAINVKTVTLPSDNNTDTLQSIANDTADADRYITFVASATGAQTGLSNASLRYNPTKKVLTLPDFGLISATATTTSTTQTAILSFSATTYAGAKIVVNATTGVNRHICELLVAHDGTTATATQYGSVTTASDLGTYDVDISGGNVRLLATSASATSTVYKVSGTLMEA